MQASFPTPWSPLSAVCLYGCDNARHPLGVGPYGVCPLRSAYVAEQCDLKRHHVTSAGIAFLSKAENYPVV